MLMNVYKCCLQYCFIAEQINNYARNQYKSQDWRQTNDSNFTSPLRAEHSGKKLREFLSTPRLQRAIGVVYKPKTELLSHYFKTVLPSQFDEYIWFNKTKAITPLITKIETPKLIGIHPFGLLDK